MKSDGVAAGDSCVPAVPVNRAGWLWRAWGHFHDVLLLTLLVVVAHKLHLLDATEAAMRRWVLLQHVADLAADPTLPRAADAGPNAVSVQVVEFSAAVRANRLDKRDTLSLETIERLSGDRPLDRCQMALAVRELAGALPDPPLERQVVALDVDLAPLEGKPSACEANMLHAIQTLRKKATVLLIVLHRLTPDARVRRNSFYRAAACTRLNERGLDPGGSAGLRALYLVSPTVMHRPHEYPLDFPTALKDDSAYSAVLPLHFPSLGWAMAVLMDAAPGTTKHPAVQQALTLMCEQAHSAEDREQALLQDCLPGLLVPCGPVPTPLMRDGLSPLDAYETQAYNWRLLEDPDALIYTTVGPELASDDPCTSFGLGRLGEDVLRQRVIVVAVDGGSSIDRFDIPNASNRLLPGATLHSVQALSSTAGRALDVHPWQGVLLDLVFGTGYLALWLAAQSVYRAFWPSGPATRHDDFYDYLFRLIVPLILLWAFGFVLTCWLIPWLVSVDLWVNPMYVIAGLTLHAYVEALHGPHVAQGGPLTASREDARQSVPKRWRSMSCVRRALISLARPRDARGAHRPAHGAQSPRCHWIKTGLQVALLVVGLCALATSVHHGTALALALGLLGLLRIGLACASPEQHGGAH